VQHLVTQNEKLKDSNLLFSQELARYRERHREQERNIEHIVSQALLYFFQQNQSQQQLAQVTTEQLSERSGEGS